MYLEHRGKVAVLIGGSGQHYHFMFTFYCGF